MASREHRRRASRHRKTPDPRAKVIGARIRKLRKEMDYNFDAFVEETGLGRGYISELERGLVVPNVNTLATVAAALELTIADLVAGDSLREELFLLTRTLSEAELKRLTAEVRKRSGP